MSDKYREAAREWLSEQSSLWARDEPSMPSLASLLAATEREAIERTVKTVFQDAYEVITELGELEEMRKRLRALLPAEQEATDDAS